MLAANATRGSVSDVVIFALPPHVRLLGPSSPFSSGVRAIGGSGLVVLIWFISLFMRGKPADLQKGDADGGIANGMARNLGSARFGRRLWKKFLKRPE